MAKRPMAKHPMAKHLMGLSAGARGVLIMILLPHLIIFCATRGAPGEGGRGLLLSVSRNLLGWEEGNESVVVFFAPESSAPLSLP